MAINRQALANMHGFGTHRRMCEILYRTYRSSLLASDHICVSNTTFISWLREYGFKVRPKGGRIKRSKLWREKHGL